MEALGQIGGGARSALPLLRDLALDKDAQLAMEASAATARISLDPKDAAVVFRVLSDPDPKVRLEALKRVQAIGALRSLLSERVDLSFWRTRTLRSRRWRSRPSHGLVETRPTP